MIHASTQAHQARRRKTSRRHRAMGDHPAPAAAAGGGPAAPPPSSGGSLDSSGSSSASAGSTAAALLADMAAPRKALWLGDVHQAQQLVWASLRAPGAAKTPASSPSATGTTHVTDVLRLLCYS